MKRRKYTGKRKLFGVLEEAEALLGRRDGCHSLRNTYHALVLLSALERQGVEIEDSMIVKLLCEMRVTARTGVPPGGNSFDEVRNHFSEVLKTLSATLPQESEKKLRKSRSLIERLIALVEEGSYEEERTRSLIAEAKKLAVRTLREPDSR